METEKRFINDIQDTFNISSDEKPCGKYDFHFNNYSFVGDLFLMRKKVQKNYRWNIFRKQQSGNNFVCKFYYKCQRFCKYTINGKI